MKLFDINDHIAKIADHKIESIIKPTFTFFEKTPYYQITNLPKFDGAGVYALFMKSTSGTCYKNRLPAMHPIYVGKAVPSGSRQGKHIKIGSALRKRLQKHLSSIRQAENLESSEFLCRFMILQGQAAEMISTIESYLIRQYNPLWNSHIDGFGINAPGAGRYKQLPSEWDTLHPGRSYVKLLTGTPPDIQKIKLKIELYSTGVGL